MAVKSQLRLHHAVSVIGGFWGGYTIFNHSDIFGNAQTGNLIHLVLDAFSGKLGSIGYMALMFFVYAAGNAFYAVMRKKQRLSMKIISFIVSAAAITLVGVLSLTGQHYLAVLPIAFATKGSSWARGSTGRRCCFSISAWRRAVCSACPSACTASGSASCRSGYRWFFTAYIKRQRRIFKITDKNGRDDGLRLKKRSVPDREFFMIRLSNPSGQKSARPGS